MAEKKQAAEAGLPDVDILMKGLLAQPGLEGYMVFNDSGASGLIKCGLPIFIKHRRTSRYSVEVDAARVY